jgi:mono/diheme cytochrome c family protein
MKRVLPLILLATFQAQAAPDIATQARGILTDHCFSCHGPDKKERKAELRLDTFEGATSDLGGYKAIVPGKPEKSEALALIQTDDKDDKMPPPKTGKVLSKEQVDILRKWIEAGAQYPIHWAYKPVEGYPAAKVSLKHPIDQIVHARLASANIVPSPDADKRTLAKRLHYDLVGLPPTLEQLDAFLADESPDAYSKLVDSLLASPHFGERWGRHWLDKARYADSDGYEKDRPRPNAWHFRDWVIGAINADMPFDQFTIEQIAGDLLPDPTSSQKLATAFHRQTLTNTEGGTDQEQWRVAAVMDRVETTGSVWLGLTMMCARCHDHKYDPISQDEYYQLFAFYNNGDETNFSLPPEKAAQAKYDKDKADHAAKLKALDEKIKAQTQKQQSNQAAWEDSLRERISNSKPSAEQPVSFQNLPDNDTLKLVQQEGNILFLEKLAMDTAILKLDASVDAAQPITGFRLEALSDPKLPSKGPGLTNHGNFVLNEFKAVSPQSGVPYPFAEARADFSQSNWDIHGAIDGNDATGWAVSPQMGKDHQATFVLQVPIPPQEAQILRIELHQLYGTKHVIGKFRITALTGDIDGSLPPANVREALLTDSGKRTGAQKKLLATEFEKSDPGLAQLRKQRDDLAKKAPKSPAIPVRVISQRGSPRKTHVFRRGEFKEPQHEVQAGTLSILPPLHPRKEGQPADRLDLANWIVSPDNPLTPRVTANEVWSHLFGKGLVTTPEDFGNRGDAPAYPELLDHLAHYLAHEAKWSRKAFIRHIVHSATYKQSSAHRPELVEIDPNNQLLHRQDRFRVEAEIVRDLTLHAAGILSPKVGGQSVFPALPNGVASLSYANNFKWDTSKGEEGNRRGMYTFFKRTSPHPNLITFDCPDSNVTCVQRRRSNTPLAALVTLNNATFANAARDFAKRLQKEITGKDDQARLRKGFLITTAREPEPRELKVLQALLESSREHYAANPEEAKAFAGDPETAALAATTRVLLNLDEFLTRE